MQLVTVTFDRIFDVVPGMRSRKPVTNFGFQSGTLRKVFVPAPGEPSLIVGTTITACLLENDNWQTLKGWVNHSNGEIIIESTSYEWFMIVWCILLTLFALNIKSDASILRLCIIAAVIAFSAYCAYSINLLREVRNNLEQFSTEIQKKLKARDAV